MDRSLREVAFVPANQNHITEGVVQAGKLGPYLPVLAGNQDSHVVGISVEEFDRLVRMGFCTRCPCSSKKEALFSNFCAGKQ